MTDTETVAWKAEEERGTLWGIRALVFCATIFGRGFLRLILKVVIFYFALTAGSARKSIAGFRAQLGLETGFWDAYKTILRFAETIADALFLLRGQMKHFLFTRDGHEILAGLRRRKQSAVILSAHLGSFYALRAAATDESLPVYPLVYTKNAAKINEAIDTLAPDAGVRLIEIGDNQMDFMLKVGELVDEGALIAIMGDRRQEGGQTLEVDFLGKKAHLPAGPYLMASALKVPVYFTCGLFRAPNHYELHCEPFAERIVLKRGARMESAQKYAQQYADRVAHYAASAPDNWFNFFDIWEQPAAASE